MTSKIRFMLVDADLADGELTHVAQTIRQAVAQLQPVPAALELRSDPPPAAAGLPAPPSEPAASPGPDADGRVPCPEGCGKRLKPGAGLGRHLASCPARAADGGEGEGEGKKKTGPRRGRSGAS